MNLKTKLDNQNQIRTLIFEEKEIDDDVKILSKIESFYEKLFKSHFFKHVSKIENFLCAIATSSLNSDQIKLCEKKLI